MKFKLFNAAQTACILYRVFGAARSWEDFLADIRRGKVDHGPLLEPICKRKRKGHWLPSYAAQDIRRFISAFDAYEPSARKYAGLVPEIVEIDASEAKHWRFWRLQATSIAPSAA